TFPSDIAYWQQIFQTCSDYHENIDVSCQVLHAHMHCFGYNTPFVHTFDDKVGIMIRSAQRDKGDQCDRRRENMTGGVGRMWCARGLVVLPRSPGSAHALER